MILFLLLTDVITEVIRYCAFETRNPDDVIIKQGERGHRLYIALQGHVSIYVINKETASDGSRDNNVINEEVLQTVTTACEQKKLDRNVLGTMVWSGDGGTFGEVALIETDCVRTASVVADTHMDLLIVERDLFNRCLRGIVAEDMLAKTQFVERNPIFRSWPPRQRKQLVISLTTERVSYGARIIRQGQEASQIYFISSGEVEIHVDPRQYKTQFPRMWEEMLTLVPDLNSR
ncbi:hypothetical protein BaRGS_00029779 [Batillaria attramentaria]|uniref:Cyclic nucleotide-binding domain-containing protein n=1 Tax=Batillaria attramentaria TaxID=370345 RepID=A0ABD0JVX3_9CAEN